MAQTTNYNFEIPDDTDLVKDGALAMRDLGQDVDTQLFTALGGDYPGLRLVKAQTVGTGVSSVIVTGAFSATYENYKILYTGGTPNTASYLNLQLRTGSTTSTANYYMGFGGWAYSGAAQGAVGVNNGSSWEYAGYAANAGYTVFNVDLYQPFTTKYTGFNTSYFIPNQNAVGGGYHDAATSFDQFVLTYGGTLTGGTIYVYGYGAS
jgi:hypothetical protein